MKVAITGAAGYIGRQIISKLKNDPEIESIVAIDRVPVRQGKVGSKQYAAGNSNQLSVISHQSSVEAEQQESSIENPESTLTNSTNSLSERLTPKLQGERLTPKLQELTRKSFIFNSKNSINSINPNQQSEISNKVEYVVCDVTSPKIVKALADCDIVVHLAFIIGDSKNRPALYRVNIDGSRNVFQAAASVGAKRLIVASSIAVYGYYPDNPDYIDETYHLLGNSDNAYSDTKRLVELILDDFEKKHPDIGVVRFRPGVILGPNTRNNFRTMLELPFWIDFKTKGKTYNFFSRTAVVHEDDVVDAFILAIKGQQRGAYNLAVEPFVTIDEILALTHQILITLPATLIAPLMDFAFKIKITDNPASDLYYAMYPIPASGKKAIAELGWQPRYSGIDAVKSLLKVIRQERKTKLSRVVTILK